MERVTGIGGVFFKSEDPKKLQAWYVEHLGVPDEGGYVAFRWMEKDRPGEEGMTVWSTFPKDTKHYQPSSAPFMINYRVRDLDAMLVQLRAAGVETVGEPESGPYGRFAWVMDPDGNKVELWEPPPSETP